MGKLSNRRACNTVIAVDTLKEGLHMHILVFITMFLIAAVVAATHGDWSGIIFIIEAIGFIAFMIVFALIFCRK